MCVYVSVFMCVCVYSFFQIGNHKKHGWDQEIWKVKSGKTLILSAFFFSQLFSQCMMKYHFDQGAFQKHLQNQWRHRNAAKAKKELEGGKTVRREVLARPLSPANQEVSECCSICLESKGGGRHDKRVVHETHPKCRISECTSWRGRGRGLLKGVFTTYKSIISSTSSRRPTAGRATTGTARYCVYIVCIICVLYSRQRTQELLEGWRKQASATQSLDIRY